MIYELSVTDLVEFELGGFGRRQRQRNWLDIDPPDRLLEAVAARTGVPVERVREMTIAGVRPFLFAYFDRKYYGYNASVLIAPSKPPQPGLHMFALRKERTHDWTACRSCLKAYPNAGVLLPWRVRIMTSCPVHGTMLEPVRVIEDSVSWLNDRAEEAPEIVRSLDHRTWNALTTGYVKLPGGLVSAGLWFRLLRTIWDELSRPLSLLRECHEQPILSIWAAVDRFMQQAANSWQSRAERIHAITVATAIDMMENGTVSAEGTDAKYFRTEAITSESFSKTIVFDNVYLNHPRYHQV